jgi:hypothetical protein
MRTLIVVKTASAADMNMACRELTTGDTFTVPLAAVGAPDVIAAFWASWDFSATGHDHTVARTKLREHGATTDETTLIPKSAIYGDVSDQTVMLFNAASWSPAEVLSLLSLTVLDSDDV